MNASLARSAIFAALAATAACSLLADLDGYSGVRPSADAALDASADAGSGDAARSSDGEAGSCTPTVTVDSSFATDLGTWVPHALRSAGYPKAESFEGVPAAVLLPVVVPVVTDAGTNELREAYSGLWRPAPVPLSAFDLEAEVYVRCTSGGSCADGLVIAWLDTTVDSALANANEGHVAGLPAATRGAGVVLDNYENSPSETSDPPPPTIQIIALDPTRPIGAYPWSVAFEGASFLGAWRKVGVRLRGGDVSVRYQGAELVVGKVPLIANGLFGFTAGTGGETDAVAIRNVKASFYPCIP